MKTKAPSTQTQNQVQTKTKIQTQGVIDAVQLVPHQKSSRMGSAFDALLNRPVGSKDMPVKAEGIAIGTLVDVGIDGSLIQVRIPSLGLGPLPAMSMVALGPQHIGQSLAVGFEGANAHKPVVLGLMMQTAPSTLLAAHTKSEKFQSDATQSAIHVSQIGRRVVVQANSELELRCGEAVILLSEDGSIQIRGAYITTHATASNRIRGGSVQIN